jgi:hypothetical protein
MLRPFVASRSALTAAALAGAVALWSCGGTVAQPGATTVVAEPAPAAPPVPLPNHPDSLKFLAFGDFGTGEPGQYELAKQMALLHQKFPFELAILMGDNMYGSERPQDFTNKFERPYKPLLDAGVKFYASLGNHDSREQRAYKLFNMDDKLFYSVKAPKESVRFFALESTYLEPEQVAWLEKELAASSDDWKIPFLHHPLYSSARGHGSSLPVRRELEPLFIKYNVSVVFQGHDHTYERTKPQNGIVYFVAGSGGKLRARDLNRRTAFFAEGFDTDLAFLALEIKDDTMTFQAISRTGAVVDSGIILRRQPPTLLSLGPRPGPAPVWAWHSPSPARRFP